MTEQLFPVGFPLGLVFEPDGDIGTASGGVRVADSFQDLSAREYRVWLLSFARDGRSALVDACRAEGIDDAPTIIEALLCAGLLVGIDSDDGVHLRAALEGLRLVTIGVGLGNSPDRPGYWAIGGTDMQPRAWLNFDGYCVWALSYRYTIWGACEKVVEDVDRSPSAVGREVVESLPALLGTASAYLDRA
jgi:hypothetical protein